MSSPGQHQVPESVESLRSTRFRNGEYSVKVSSSPAVQREETDRDTEEADTTQDGLSQRRRSHGSEPRRGARGESTVRADDGDANKA